jgi:hypothetical protein
MMRVIRIYPHEIEARLAEGHLQAHGIQTILRGAKDYASIVTGAGMGRFELLVSEEDFVEAQRLLLRVLPPESPAPTAAVPSNKRLIFGFILLVIVLAAIARS